jgi:hypothetical protein
MICNDLVMPLLLRSKRLQPGRAARHDPPAAGHPARRDRHRGAARLSLLPPGGRSHALVSIGLISFAAVAQFAPVMLGGMYWRGGTRDGALAGLLAGFAVWAYTLMLPSVAKSGWIDPASSSTACSASSCCGRSSCSG